MVSGDLDFTDQDILESIPARFRKVAERLPDHLAVVSPEGRISYAELDGLSEQMAAQIRDAGLQGESLFAILMEQSILAIGALLAVLKTGSAYLLLSPATPKERMRQYWEDAGCPVVLTDQASLAEARLLTQQGGILNLVDGSFQGSLENTPNLSINPQDTAAVFYTSGSVGELKGVIWTHEMILHTALLNQQSYHILPGDRLAVLASYGYGASMTQSFAALLSGATLYLPETPHHDLRALGDWILENQITILGMPPLALLRQILNLLSDQKPVEHLRMAVLGGEDLFKGDIELFREVCSPDAVLAYRLAGSETLVMCENLLDRTAELPAGKIPVGHPVRDLELILLPEEQNGALLDAGAGEISIISRYLSPGYWRKPELTARKFFPDPDQPDRRIYHTGDLGRFNERGELVYIGRRDNTVRIHGFGVQLEEIEGMIERLPEVKEAVVTAAPGGREARLVAYLVPRTGKLDPKLNLRTVLETRLPRYMIPSQVVWVENIPRTPTGKIDRKKLPAPDRKRPELKEKFRAAGTDLEEQLASIWKSLLSLDRVGVDDNFFELGGDSLLVLELSLELEREFSYSLPQVFFQDPTITSLAQLIDTRHPREETEQAFSVYSFNQDQGNDSSPSHSPHRSQRKVFRTDLLARIEIALGKLRDSFVGSRIVSRSYQDAREWAVNWSKSSLVQNSVYFNVRQLFNEWLQVAAPEAEPADDLFQLNILNNAFYHIPKVIKKEEKHRVDEVQRYLDSDYPYWRSLGELIDSGDVDRILESIPMKGLNHLREAHQRGNGVILVSFHGTPHSGGRIPLTKVMGVDQIPTISYLIPVRQSGFIHQRGRISDAALSALSAEIALYGQKKLKEGGIVFFASDTENTPGYAQRVTVAGRELWIKPGFAEMSLNTGAPVIPLARYCLADGRTQMEFFPALEAGEGEHSVRAARLVAAYGKFVDHSLKAHPEAISWQRMRIHLNLPPSEV